MNKRARGFTLIEVLVVVSILGVLMGLVSVLVLRSASKQKQSMTETLVTAFLPQLIDRYKIEFRRLPPCTIAGLNKNKRWKSLASSDTTGINENTEALIVALRHPDFTTPLGDGDLPIESPYGNGDEDAWNSVPDGSSSEDSQELLDGFGSVIVYIDKNNYGKTFTVLNFDGEEIQVTAHKKPDGSWYNATKYQIISLGEDGQFADEPGSGDDIYNFKPSEAGGE